MASAIIKQF